MLAYPYGTLQMISSFPFDDADAGPPAEENRMTSPADCGSGAWVCEHRHPVIAGMAGFYGNVQGTELNN